VATLERSSSSVEAMRALLDYLVAERTRLRAHGSGELELEANRQAILAIRFRLLRASAQGSTADD